MQKRQNKLMILVLAQLLVLALPFLIKSFHHHSLAQVHSIPFQSSTTQLWQENKPCPVCQIEWISFVFKKTGNEWFHPVFPPVHKESEYFVFIPAFFDRLQNRAPPFYFVS
jgi:hypothetical protein